MNKEKKSIVQRICLWAGVGLLVLGILVLAVWQWGISISQKQAQAYVQTIRTLLPEPQNAVPEARRDNTMPVMAVDGIDFAGILEMPRYDSSLPVAADWGESAKYPCCFSGSIYDGTLQIGATTQAGQYDFYREISAGDTVQFTDMAGNRYTYTVADLRYESHADQTALNRKDADLTIFIKNIYAMEYLVIFCDVPK